MHTPPLTPTIAYYNTLASAYAQDTLEADMTSAREEFLGLLPPVATSPWILDFGCGAGRDTKAFREMGYQVEAVDGSERLCELARANSGARVRCMLFEELDELECYDGIWACASILHLPKAELAGVLARAHRALKPGGILYTSFKYGDFEGERDGRYFTYFTAAILGWIQYEKLKWLQNMNPEVPSLVYKLPQWEPFFERFASNQYLLYGLIHDENLPGVRKRYEACYRDNLHSIWAGQELYRKGNSQQEFVNILNKNMRPVYDSARRQGYQVWG